MPYRSLDFKRLLLARAVAYAQLEWDRSDAAGEFNLVLLAMSIGLLLSGPGKFAMDRMLGLEQK